MYTAKKQEYKAASYGLRVNRPTEHVVVRNCFMGAGGGITLGSETSGGIRDVEIYNILPQAQKMASA